MVLLENDAVSLIYGAHLYARRPWPHTESVADWLAIGIASTVVRVYLPPLSRLYSS